MELSSLQSCKVGPKICNQNKGKNLLQLSCLTYLKVDLWSFGLCLVILGLFARYTPVAPSNSQIEQLLFYSAIVKCKVWKQPFSFERGHAHIEMCNASSLDQEKKLSSLIFTFQVCFLIVTVLEGRFRHLKQFKARFHTERATWYLVLKR